MFSSHLKLLVKVFLWNWNHSIGLTTELGEDEQTCGFTQTSGLGFEYSAVGLAGGYLRDSHSVVMMESLHSLCLGYTFERKFQCVCLPAALVCWKYVMKGIRELRESTFNGGVKEAPLYFVFSPVLGGEFIPPVAVDGDCRVWGVWF